MLRTYPCGALNSSHVGSAVTLAGWVHTRRDHGNLIFIDLRDRWGLVQLVFNPEKAPELHASAEQLRSEYVIQVQGKVRQRPAGTENSKISTGEIEVEVDQLQILNPSLTPPFEIGGTGEVSEEIRLKYRFLDLRRPGIRDNLLFRYELIRVIRDYFHSHKFVEIETPYLTKSTPEGARDFLVPSRLNPGNFFALPQSPQLFKQLLMVAGFDRYFQLARCFRDEDLRADRQPEHTQIDFEMSFAEEEDVREIAEGMMREVFDRLLGQKLTLPIPRIPYDKAIARYGTDKPDLRVGMFIEDVTDEIKGAAFRVFSEAIERGHRILAMNFLTPKGVSLSRKDFDGFTQLVSDLGAQGLVWFKVAAGGEIESPVAKFFEEERRQRLIKKMGAQAGHAIFMVAGESPQAAAILGALRLHLADRHLSLPKDRFELCWVTDFPLFEWSPEEKRFVALHHPFTSPQEADLAFVEAAPQKVRAKAYDLVMNGTEIGGGSIRIHREDVQKKVFQVLQLSPKQAEEKFGFLLKALSYGAPPHGGMALGVDRLTALFRGEPSIREVMAFPKTQKGNCPMTEAPAPVSPVQLKELKIKLS